MTDAEIRKKADAIADIRILRGWNGTQEDEMRKACLRRVSEGFDYDFKKGEWVRFTPYSRSYKTDSETSGMWTITDEQSNRRGT